MNKGLHPDDITRMVHLPPYLADHPYLQEFYGTVEWSVKGVYCNYIGWFNGKWMLCFSFMILATISIMVSRASHSTASNGNCWSLPGHGWLGRRASENVWKDEQSVLWWQPSVDPRIGWSFNCNKKLRLCCKGTKGTVLTVCPFKYIYLKYIFCCRTSNARL